MEFTGERYLPDMGGELRMEHVHRYAFCLPYVKNKVVLDAACGEGYGSALLASVAASVTGVDVSEAAVTHARASYAAVGERLRFEAGDATALTFPDAHFDVVVSFETIEHVLAQEDMMAGFRRVLKRGGLLILSSPDKRTYSDEPNFHNEFHVKELYLDELRAMVGRHFKRHVLLGQRLTGGSAIFLLDKAPADKIGRPQLLADDGQHPDERSARLADPVYLLAMATNGSALPAPHASVLLTEQEDPLQSLRRIARWASGVDTEMNALRASTTAEMERLRNAFAQEQARSQALESRVSESSAMTASAHAKVLAAEAQLRDARAERERALAEHQAQLDVLRAESSSLQRQHALERAQEAAQVEALLAQHRSQTEALQANAARLVELRGALQARIAELEAAERRWNEDRRELATQADRLLKQVETQREQLTQHHQDLMSQRDSHAAAQTAWQAEKLALAVELDTLRADQRAALAAAEAAALEAARRVAASEADSALRLTAQAREWQSRLDAREAQFLLEHARHAQLWNERQSAADALVAQVRLDSEQALLRAASASQEQRLQLETELAQASAAHALRVQTLQADAVAQQQSAQAEIDRCRHDLLETRQQLQHAQLALHRQSDLAAQGMRRQQEQANQERDLLHRATWNAQQCIAALAQASGQALESLRLSGMSRQATPRQALDELLRMQQGLHLALQTLNEAVPSRPGLQAAEAAPPSLVALMGLDDAAFLREAYRWILQRELDSDGLEHYLSRLRQGEQRLRILSDLRLSPEGQRRPVLLAGLDDAIRSLRKSRIPLLGRRERLRLQTWLAPTGAAVTAVDAVEPATTHITRIASALDNLERGSSLLAEAVPIAVALGRAPRELGLDPWACAQELVRADSGAFVELSYALLCQRAPSTAEAQRERTRLEAGASRVYILNLLLDNIVPAPAPAAAADAASMPRSLAVLSLGAGSRLPTHEHPVVSVIVVTSGRLDCTLRCLRSMLLHPPTTPFELIVVDDGSPDGTASALANVGGLRLVALDSALGFAASCAAGANAARGEWLHFVGNDSEVQSGWLDELRLTFDIFPGTGIAGSQLLFPDGRLRAAGSVIRQDGSVSPVGHGEDAAQSCFAHAREVDACSAASWMVPTHLYAAVAGLGSSGTGTDCVELGVALATRGYRVIYQPLSRVVHHASADRNMPDPAVAADATAASTSTLLPRWGAALQAYPPAGTPLEQAARHRLSARLLAIEHRLPRPDRDAGSVSVFNMLMAARELGMHVSLVAEADVTEGNEADLRHVQMLQRSGIEVLLRPQVHSLHAYLEAHGQDLDAVLLYRPVVMERHAALVTRLCPKAKRIYYPHDLHFLRLSRQAASTGDAALAAEAEQRRPVELALQNRADMTLVASDIELQLLTQAGLGDKTRWLPLLLDTTRVESPVQPRKGMLFVGGFHHAPNLDAVLQLVEDIMPRVRALRPDIELWVVGEAPPQTLTQRHDVGVHYLGAVDDLNALLGTVCLAIAPIRFGAGAKGKVARPMAAGVPVVASAAAIEGMGLAGGEQVLLADNADAFAAAVIHLHEDSALWQRLSDAGHAHAEAHWGPQAAGRQMAGIMQALGLGTRPMPFSARFFKEAVHLRLSLDDSPRLT
jgi:SAM-dependent methyltransferase/GT2 family glycosyltransferase/glycosyltransferase involved in cell wall biosynthesis